MAKLVLTDVANLSGAEATAIATINANWALIEAALENTYSLDGTSPNALEADLDFDSNQALNVPAPVASTDLVRKQDVEALTPSIFVQASEPSATGIDGSLWIDSDSTDVDVYREASSVWVDTTLNLIGATGATGATGAAGFDGATAGVTMTFSNDTTTTTDPGAGNFEFNNATVASVTEIAVDDNSAETGNPAIDAFVATFDDSTSTNKGIITFRHKTEPEIFAVFTIQSLTDATTHHRLGVTHIASSGTFDNTDPFVMHFTPSGDAGAAQNTFETFTPPSGDPIVADSSTDTFTITTSTGLTITGTAATDTLAFALAATLQDIAGLAVTDGGVIVGDGSNFVLETGATARASIGADNVTLAGTPDYLTLSGQEITRNPIDLTADVTGVLPAANLPDAGTAAEGVVELATADEYRGNDSADLALTVGKAWDAMAEVALTSSSNSVAWDMDGGIDFDIDTLGENTTIANPTNVIVGKKGRLRIVQDGTGSRTVAWGSNFEFAGGTAPTATTTASAEDIFYYDCISATRILITSVLDIS